MFFFFKDTFLFNSSLWTNKETFHVENGLNGLNENETKMPSYWNTPFEKMCLRMKHNDKLESVIIRKEAPSLHSLIADDSFIATDVKKANWKGLIHGSELQKYCNKEGFNIQEGKSTRRALVRLGFVANNGGDQCETCNSFIGFGGSVVGCKNEKRQTACGNVYDCGEKYRKNLAFGFILVH